MEKLELMKYNSSLKKRKIDRMMSNKTWNELPQVTDNYVVHARGYNVSDKMWFDVYSFHPDHMNLWNKEVRHELDYPKYEDEKWVDYADENVDESWLYWCVTGSSGLTVQRQSLKDMTQGQMQLILDIVLALRVPEEESVSFYDYITERSSNLDISRLYDMIQ